MTSAPTTFLFSGYARLPQDVSHQAMYKRVGVVLEVDEAGAVVACSTTLMMASADDFFQRLLVGRNVLTGRREIEALVRYRYRGHSQGALVSALHKIFEAVDQSPLAPGEAAGLAPSAAAPNGGSATLEQARSVIAKRRDELQAAEGPVEVAAEIDGGTL